MQFDRVFTDAPWEKKVGYCRAIKAGPYVHLTGTAPVTNEGKTYSPGNAYEQTKKCFEIIEDSLGKFDVPISKIVRTRMFVTDISKWEEYGKAHAEFLGNHPPTTSMIEVKSLIDPEMLIEIEVDAYVEP